MPLFEDTEAVLAGCMLVGPDTLRRLVGFESLIEPVAEALAAFSRGLGEAPVALFAPRGADGDVHVKAAWLPGHPLFTVKVGTWFAAKAAGGRPSAGGLIAAFDAESGDLRALLRDDHHLSDVRTAAAGSLAASLLARPDSRVLGVMGSGVQAYLQILAAAHVLPVLGLVRLWGRTAGRVDKLRAAVAARRPDLQVEIVQDASAAVLGADVLITATSSREPLVHVDWVGPGLHVTAVGADDAVKCELSPDLLARADRIIVDSRDLALRLGDVRYAIGAGVMGPEAITGELGAVVAGTIRRRKNGHEITVAKLVGLGVQDLVAVEAALAAVADRGTPAVHPASAVDLEQAGSSG